MPAFDDLATLIASGYPTDRKNLAEKTEKAIDGLFGERYRKNSPHAKRIAFMPGDENVPFAGLVHRDSPPSGMYGGMSLRRLAKINCPFMSLAGWCNSIPRGTCLA
jgi:hypothetical protein